MEKEMEMISFRPEQTLFDDYWEIPSRREIGSGSNKSHPKEKFGQWPIYPQWILIDPTAKKIIGRRLAGKVRIGPDQTRTYFVPVSAAETVQKNKNHIISKSKIIFIDLFMIW